MDIMLVFAFMGQKYPWMSYTYIMEEMDFRLFTDYFLATTKLQEMADPEKSKKFKRIEEAY